MSDELRSVDLSEMTMDDVRRLKNQAIQRLKAAGQFSLDNAMHQNGVSHTNHHTQIAFDPDVADLAAEADVVEAAGD